MVEATKHDEAATPKHEEGGGDLMRGLAALDEAIIKQGNPGPKGSGIFLLLETCASQFLGVPRAGFPAPKPKDEPPPEHAPAPATPHASEPPKPAGARR